jgi:O-antigen ligase
VLFALLSTLWSVYPELTLYKSLEFFTTLVLLVAIVYSERSPSTYRGVFDLTWALCGCLLISVWLGAVLWPEQAFEESGGLLGVQLSGVLPVISANGVGETSALLALVCASRLGSGRLGMTSTRSLLWLVFVVSVGTLVLSQTRTAWVGFMVGLVFVVAFSGRTAALALFTLIIAGIGWAAGLGHLAFSYFLRGQSPAVLGALSGRFDWWQAAWGQFLTQPLTGYGAYAGGRFAVLSEIGQANVTSLHSTYLEVLVGTGLLGFAPLLAALFATWWILLRALKGTRLPAPARQLTVEAVAVLALVTVRSFFAAHLVWHHFLTLVFLILVGHAEILRQLPRSALVQVPRTRTTMVEPKGSLSVSQNVSG